MAIDLVERLVNEIDMLDSAINQGRVRILAGPALTDSEVTCFIANIVRRTVLNTELEKAREQRNRYQQPPSS